MSEDTQQYCIAWSAPSTGRSGRGTKRFSKEEAEKLVKDLNRQFALLEHQAVPAPFAEGNPPA